ncbi:ciliary protein causing leber congenital amaurosis disease domain-containing protein [Phthorimaea operculella]|nr:ciliary protein causing leber congenital amaurosis disease domain-containing protein [Phthorimaea operculella]
MSVLSLIPEDKLRDPRKDVQSVYSSNSRLNLLQKRKRQNPLGEMSGVSKGDRYVAQRVLSAKAHRVKQLQNQLSDAHYHLQELSNENKILRALQKKQEVALQRYESSSAELPTVLSSHNEELRIQQAKFKQLKKQFTEVQQKLKERDLQLQQLRDEHNHLLELSRDRWLRASEGTTSQGPTTHCLMLSIQKAKFKQLKKQFTEVQQKLKERDLQLQQLRDEHNHLLELSRDRNLPEREKLQQQVTELTSKVQQQADTISMLQRRLALEAKNFRHQLQMEINKHKDTRHDLDLAISNADKLTSIIGLKEKMLSTAASRTLKSPTKATSAMSLASNRPVSKSRSGNDLGHRDREDRTDRPERCSNLEQLSKLCENSRSITSALSHDEGTSSSSNPRSSYARSRASSNSTRSTPNPRKNSKGSDDMIEIAKTVQEGMADLSIFDELEKSASPTDDMQKKLEYMKKDLMNKIKHDEPKKASIVRRQSTEESIEEQIVEVDVPPERPKSRGRRGSSVSFYNDIEETTTTISINDYRSGDEMALAKPKSRVSSGTERKLGGKPLDKYCKDIMQDIETSSRVIDKHMKQFTHSKYESDKLVEQLNVVDKINDFVNSDGQIPAETLQELNNNFKMLTDNVMTEAPIARKRSISGRRNSRIESQNAIDDSSMSNQDLLNDLLGRK